LDALLNVSLPFFALIFGGYAAGHFGLLSGPAQSGLNSFVFWFALPAMLFMKMSEAPVVAAFDWRFIAAYSGGGLFSFALALVLGRLLFRSPAGAGAIQGMAAAYGNVGYMGLPIAITVFGDRAVLPAVLVIVADGIILFTLTTALIEGATGRHTSFGRILRQVLVGLARNPLIVATVAGLLWGLTAWRLPVPVAAFGNLMANAAAPCALFALGATLVGRPIAEGLGEVALMTACKLAVHPTAVWMLAGLVLDLDPTLTAIAVTEASLPIAANVFIMARAYDTYAERASTAILVSTVIAVVSVSAYLAVFTGY
jgi:predicted permease